MSIKSSRKKTTPGRAPQSDPQPPLFTGNIKISGHAATESGEPFVRLEVGGKRVLVRVNNLLLSPNFEFARLQNHGARLLDSAAQRELTRRIETALRQPAAFTVATTPGWHGEAFVFPDGVVPKRWSDVDIYLEDDGADLYALGVNPVAAAAPGTAYAALQAYLNGPSAKTFINLREAGASVPPGHVHASAPGYRGLYRGSQEIWLPYDCFERIAGGPAESRALKVELHAKGLIASEMRGNGRSFSVKRDIPGLRRTRVIALRVR
jgi:hypothetical protein